MESVFNHTAHKALWGWLSKHPDKEKVNWPGWKWNGGEYEDSGIDCNRCFACMFVTYPKLCRECPIIWPGDEHVCISDNGLFAQWDDCKVLQRRSELAEQIRDLPVREGVKCI